MIYIVKTEHSKSIDDCNAGTTGPRLPVSYAFYDTFWKNCHNCENIK